MPALANAIFYEAEYQERYFTSSPNNRADWLAWMRRYVWAADLPPFCLEADARSAQAES
jgi:hypothetical protein